MLQPTSETIFFIAILHIFLMFFATQFLTTYTQAGMALKNHILGFKMFLEATESERMHFVGTPPTKTPELYETYLPYAIALGVEKRWYRKFVPIFQEYGYRKGTYKPHWCNHVLFRSFGNSLTKNIAQSLPSSRTTQSAGTSGTPGGGRGGGGVGSW